MGWRHLSETSSAPLGAENSVSLPDPIKAHRSSPTLLGMVFESDEEKKDPLGLEEYLQAVLKQGTLYS